MSLVGSPKQSPTEGFAGIAMAPGRHTTRAQGIQVS